MGDEKKSSMPSWAVGAVAVIGAVAGLGSAGWQMQAPPVTHAELSEKVDQKDVDKLVVAVDGLAVKVMDLTIEVRTRKAGP